MFDVYAFSENIFWVRTLTDQWKKKWTFRRKKTHTHRIMAWQKKKNKNTLSIQGWEMKNENVILHPKRLSSHCCVGMSIKGTVLCLLVFELGSQAGEKKMSKRELKRIWLTEFRIWCMFLQWQRWRWPFYKMKIKIKKKKHNATH